MNVMQRKGPGILLCLLVAVPAYFLGKVFPLVGGAVFALLSGMCVAPFLRKQAKWQEGVQFVAKDILQYAVVFLGFGLNLQVVWKTGKESLPIILTTISTSLLIAYLFYKIVDIPKKTAILIGVGSSICGGSAIAATAPVIEAEEDQVAQAISVIFLFNILAALLFPMVGVILNFPQTSGDSFGTFVGTAVNDTSSVTATAATWDSMFQLGNQTLDKAVTVKLTRTLAIIPITMLLGMSQFSSQSTSQKQTFPTFILGFIAASLVTSLVLLLGGSEQFFLPFKVLSKFLIIMAMAAIGYKTDVIKLIREGGKPILLGLCCWLGITIMTLLIQAR
ncbi:putative sulfate exporter family transporter [Facklamia sp. DSM 111018]|uniref:Sulfate exporter family transporter n=1 Tax=Facklamia lactis TaxID=2749967 RepID=A0ABS0LR97_9LACT|nr:putative sulfate exporter family transporter [Facklamia lactis]MBG9980945.1 putative sulfate exporter family transporter [Facklamia lactis]MBG9986692.1 putative sulfate exporter family transporter [Facklamia lactis]